MFKIPLFFLQKKKKIPTILVKRKKNLFSRNDIILLQSKLVLVITLSFLFLRLKFSFIKNALIHFFLFVNFEIHGIC